MSGPNAEVAAFEVIASARRSWSPEEKQSVLAEAAEGLVSVSEVARRHGMSRDLLFRWRRELRQKAEKAAAKDCGPGFIALSLPPPTTNYRNGSLEIVLREGHKVIVGKDADLALLKHVIAILEPR